MTATEHGPHPLDYACAVCHPHLSGDPLALTADAVRDALTTGTVHVVRDNLSSAGYDGDDYFTAAVVMVDGRVLTFDCGHLHHGPGAASRCVRGTDRRWSREWVDADVAEVSPGVVEIKRQNGQPGRWVFTRVHVTPTALVVLP